MASVSCGLTTQNWDKLRYRTLVSSKRLPLPLHLACVPVLLLLPKPKYVRRRGTSAPSRWQKVRSTARTAQSEWWKMRRGSCESWYDHTAASCVHETVTGYFHSTPTWFSHVTALLVACVSPRIIFDFQHDNCESIHARHGDICREAWRTCPGHWISR